MSTPPSAPKPPFSSSSPFSRPSNSNVLSRFGSRASFEFLPLHDTLVRFSLADVSGDIYQFLDIPIPHNEQGEPTPEDIKPLIAEIDQNRAAQDKLREWLKESWNAINLTGATHVYDWQEDTRNAVNKRLEAVKQPPRYIRCLDAALTLNVLVRARSYLMIPDAALALDRPFLERILLSDDTRLLKFTQERRHKEDALVDPPPFSAEDVDFEED